MMMRYLLAFFFLLLNLSSYSQQHDIFGTVKSGDDMSGLPGATVILEKQSEVSSKTSQGMVTDIEGNFRFENVEKGFYNLKIQFIGFASQELSVEVVDQSINKGEIVMQEEATTLDAIEIVAKIPVGEQKSDTTEFNAGAFKTAPDASSQQLVEKIPGINMVDGRIQAQGENVEQILIDGKPFFGNDVNTALRSLPADAVASIQVFDQRSDKSLMSGFDDGERIRTINIITKPNRKKGIFGKTTAGYGTDERYMAGANVNFFNGDRRITTTGLSNNINTLSFSADPNNEGDSRPQNGIITTHSAGINFIDTWNEKIDVSGSYFFTRHENERAQSIVRDYLSSSDSGQVYFENNINTDINTDHRVDVRFDYKINKKNRLIIRPSVSLKRNTLSSFFLGNTETIEGPLNETENTSGSKNTDYDYYNRITYGHKFAKEGRSISFGLNTSYHTNEDGANRKANNIFYDDEQGNETLNQYTNLVRTGLSWDGQVSYTEPLSPHSQIEVEYQIGNRLNDSDKRTYDFVEEANAYSMLDTAISNTFDSEYLTQQTELGYQYKKGKFNIQLELEYQHAQLTNNQVFPGEFHLDRGFQSFLPSARLEYRFSKNRNLEINYRTWTNEPNLGQLQNVIDNSNPLQLRTGNPNLDQSYNSWLRAQFRSNNPETGRTLYASVQNNLVNNFIANSTFIADEATAIDNEIILEKGSQLIRPVNVDGFINLRSYFNYGQPLNLISSNISLSGSANYSRRPGMINDQVNMAKTSNFRFRLGVSSNISENFDFNISTRSSYSVVKNTLRPALNNNFFNQNSRLSLTWNIWEGFVFRTDVNHQVNTGLAEGLNTNFALWNMSVGKKVFKNQLGEIGLTVYDLLKQNNNIRRNINEVYIEDIQSNVLQRYFMVTFTYNLRMFSRGASMDDFEGLMKD